ALVVLRVAHTAGEGKRVGNVPEQRAERGFRGGLHRVVADELQRVDGAGGRGQAPKTLPQRGRGRGPGADARGHTQGYIPNVLQRVVRRLLVGVVAAEGGAQGLGEVDVQAQLLTPEPVIEVVVAELGLCGGEVAVDAERLGPVVIAGDRVDPYRVRDTPVDIEREVVGV